MPSTNANATPLPARIQPFHIALHKFQQYILQTYLLPSSPSSYTQSSLFAQYAPLTILLSTFALGAFLPRHVNLDLEDLSTSTRLLRILKYLLLGAGAGLAILRLLIWIGARMVWAFCEIDLGEEKERIRGESGDGEDEMELTEGNLILGGLFG